MRGLSVQPRHAVSAREIHHRVKNSLQVIASILRLQMRREPSTEAQQALSGAIQRILGLVQVHELLSNDDRSEVPLRELLARLLALNTEHFLMPGQVIHPSVEGPELSVDAVAAQSIGIIVNELIVNALKHAFSGAEEGRLVARARLGEGRLEIEVADDGTGLPPDFTLTGDSNLGLRLVRSILGEDLLGEFDLRRDGGWTVARLRFPWPLRTVTPVEPEE